MSSSGLGRGRDKAGDVGVGEERLMGAYQCLLLDADSFIKQHTCMANSVQKGFTSSPLGINYNFAV
jgi:hypothetical protein